MTQHPNICIFCKKYFNYLEYYISKNIQLHRDEMFYMKTGHPRK